MTEPNFQLGPDGELPDHIVAQLPPPPPPRRTPRKFIRLPRSTILTALFSAFALCGFVLFFFSGFRSEAPVINDLPLRAQRNTQATQAAFIRAHAYYDGIPSCAGVPDVSGSMLVFRAGPSSGLELLRTDASGSNLCRLTFDLRLKYDPTISPDGRQIAFTRQAEDNYLSLYSITRDSNIFMYLSSADTLLLEPDWSPDGAQFVLRTSRGLALAPATTGEILRDDLRYLTQDEHDGAPDWSPDGSKIAFVRGADVMGNAELYIMNADGSDVRRMTANGVDEQSPHWSPDGQQLVYAAAGRIYVMDMGSGSTQQLDAAGYLAYDPVWSPDGRWIAFASQGSNERGDFALFVMDRDGHNVRPLTPPLGVADIDWR